MIKRAKKRVENIKEVHSKSGFSSINFVAVTANFARRLNFLTQTFTNKLLLSNHAVSTKKMFSASNIGTASDSNPHVCSKK